MSGATCQSTRRNNAEMVNLNPNNITKIQFVQRQYTAAV